MVTRHSWEQSYAKVQEVYQQLLGGGVTPHPNPLLKEERESPSP